MAEPAPRTASPAQEAVALDPPDSTETIEFAAQRPPDSSQSRQPPAPIPPPATTPDQSDSAETTEFAAQTPPDDAEPAPLPSQDTQPNARHHAATSERGLRWSQEDEPPTPPDTEETQAFVIPGTADSPEPADPPAPSSAAPPDTGPTAPAPKWFEPDDTQALEDLANLLQEYSATLAQPLAPPPPEPQPEPTFNPFIPTPGAPEAHRNEAHAVPEPVRTPPSETVAERLQRLVLFVARQEPGLRWAAGVRQDGTTLLVTDIAHGWIPPGITLPADVHVLKPGRRHGAVDTLLGDTEQSATYTPGDPLGWSADDDLTLTAPQPRTLPAVDDLGWVLSDATHWRDGMPRMISTLAKTATRGMGIVDSELNVLRAYRDTARHQLFAQYPAVDTGLLLNYLLVAATEGLASSDVINANYHLAWFQALSTS